MESQAIYLRCTLILMVDPASSAAKYIATACTTPWPFNFIAAESRGAVRAVREVLHYGGYKILGKIVKPGTKTQPQIPQKLLGKAKILGRRF